MCVCFCERRVGSAYRKGNATWCVGKISTQKNSSSTEEIKQEGRIKNKIAVFRGVVTVFFNINDNFLKKEIGRTTGT